MASFGAKFPYFCPVKEEPEGELPIYSGDPVRIGRLVKADLSVTLASGKLFADDVMAESVDEFAGGSIAMETDDMTDDTASVVYGVEVLEGTAHYNVSDDPPKGGLGYLKKLMRNKKVLYNTQLLKQWMKSVGATAEDVEGIIQNIEKTIQGIDYDPDVDYSSLMLAAETLEEFEQYAAQRTAKIIGEHIDTVAQGYADNAKILEQWRSTVDQTMSGIEKSVNGVSYDPNIDYSALMMEAKSVEEFLELANKRSAKIAGENIDVVARGYADNIQLLEQWSSAIKESRDDLVRTADDMAAEFSEKMEEITKSLNDAIQEMNVKEEAFQVGTDNIRGLIDGTLDMKNELVDTYAQMGREALAAYKREVDQRSPSHKFEQAGRFDIQGLIRGAEEEKNNLDAAYAKLAQTALRNMERHLPSTLVEPPAAAAQDRQTAAIIAAVSNRCENAGGITIHIDKLEARDESDVKRIAQELYYMVQRENRSRGGGFL